MIQQVLEDKKKCYNESNHSLLGGRGKLYGWGYSGGNSIDISTFLQDQSILNMFDNIQAKFDCDSCVSCENDQKARKKDKEGFCCGCISMQYVYGYTDFDVMIDPPEDGEWIPGHQPRSELEIDEEAEQLEKRSDGTATISPKSIKACGIDVVPQGLNRYPAFPADSTFKWDGIEHKRWDPISRYWGNASASCTNWAAGQLTVADVDHTPAGIYRAKYQSISRFLSIFVSLRYEYI